MTYAYDARGDLVSFTDRENNQTTFTYNSNHGLLTLKDPRGIQPFRNEYDDGGPARAPDRRLRQGRSTSRTTSTPGRR